MKETLVWSMPFVSVLFSRGMTVMTTAVRTLPALSMTSDGAVHEPEAPIESIPYLPQKLQQLCRGSAVDAPTSVVHHLLIHACGSKDGLS